MVLKIIFVQYVLTKYFKIKIKKWKCVKKNKIKSKTFLSIFGCTRASTPFKPQNWKWNRDDNYFLSTNSENFSFLSWIVSKKKPGQRDPPRTGKLAISQNWKCCHQKTKNTSSFLLSFHENRSNRFREICCTKSGRKIRIIIITRFDLVASNE